ncbi:MFS transporter [Microbacterium terrae]|nr:MFS transporter [Microbacterium terrae]
MQMTPSVPAAPVAEGMSTRSTRERMPVLQVLAVLLAQLTISVALITPTTYSLAIWLQDTASASRDALLAAAIGGSSVASLLVGPLIGALSDRTTVRLGPRRTWLVSGLVAGSIGSIIMIGIPSPVALVLGWCIAAIGYGAANSMVMVYLSDRLPQRQRGKVLGVSTAVIYLGPVVGVLLAGAVATTPPLMFAIPSIAALLGGGVLILVMHDPPVEPSTTPLRVVEMLEGYWVHPRRSPRFAWVWWNRAIFFLGVAFMTLYSVYFLSTNIALDSAQIAATMSLGGVIGVAVSTLGGVTCGTLSDRSSSRLPFIVASTVLLALGLVVIATASSVPQYLVGNGINSFAIGVYSAVGQALQFDVIPGERRNGRYLAVLGLSNQLPQAIGPFVAAGVLAVFGRDYAAMYFTAAGLVLLSLITIVPLRHHLRIPSPTSEPATSVAHTKENA